MSQHRGPLLLILFAVVIVTGGYASPIHKSAIHDDFGFHSAYANHSSTSTDNWLGGTGDWSDPSYWDFGLPSGGSDVVIYSGGSDLVYLDTNATIASLTLGGTTGSSELSSTSTTNYLIIAGALTVNQTGTLSLDSSDTVAAASLSVNSGTINLNGGSTLQVYGDASNLGSVSLGTSSGGNNLTVNGTLTNQGSLALYASSANVGSLVNGGMIDLENGSVLQVNGDANNFGSITLGSFSGGNVFTVNGSLVNGGMIDLENGSILQVNGDANNSGSITLGSSSGGNSLIVNGTLTNQGSLTLYVSSANVGSLVNGGMIDLENGSGLQVNGDASGFFFLNGSWLAVNGTLYDAGLALYNSSAGVGGSANAGGIDLEGSGLQVNGDANVGSVSMSYSSMAVGGSMDSSGISMDHSSLTVNGMLANHGNFLVNSASTANVVSLVNYGTIDLDYASQLQVNGDATNSGSIFLGEMGSGRSILSVNGMLTNHGRLEIDPAGAFPNTVKVGSLANDGMIDLTANSALYVNGDVNNRGSIATGTLGFGFGDTMMVGGRLTNGATGTFSLDGASDVANIGSVINQGAVYIASGATLNVTGGPRAAGSVFSGFTNIGIVNIAQNGRLAVVGNYVQTAGQTTVDGSLNVSARGMINFAGGTVYGNQGTISGPIISNASINIGDSLQTIGQLYFIGNYTQGPHGSLIFDIAGPELGQYDQVNVSGHALLNGLMTVDLLHSFVPQIGNTFDIMNFASESGTFSMVLGLPINGEEHFVLEYNATDLTLDVVSGPLLGANNDGTTLIASNLASGGTSNITSSITSSIASDYGPSSSTPEPGSLLLLSSGLLFVGYSVRRRMTK